jgi:carbonic anhydrase
MNKNTPIERLKTGNSNFVYNKLANKNQDSIRRLKILGGQNPFAVILTCADSRVVPELIFDTGLGDLFVVRVAGNIANQSSIASIEYAVAHLNVELIVVLGHQNCGAVTAAAKGDGVSEHLDHLLNHVKPAISNVDSGVIDEIAIENVCLTAKKLNNDSKIIADAISTGDLKIVPAFYSLEIGSVDFLD